MNILQLCKKFPFPAKDGESVAILSMSQGIASRGSQISLLAMNTSKHFVDVKHDAESLQHYKEIRTVFIQNRVDPIDAFLNLFTNKSYNIERFISSAFKSQLIRLLESNKYDVIQLESLFMAPYIETIRKYTDARIVMRSHNLEFEIWENLSAKTKNPVLKWYYSLCSKRLKNYEFNNLKDLDTIVFISSEDAIKYKSLGYTGAYHVSPVGFNVLDYNASGNARKIKKLGYIGSLDWKPNIEGIEWFLSEAWPLIKKTFPDLEFHLAGRNAGTSLINSLPKSIHFHGEIDNALNFINDLDILIVPLFSGSGIRVKILEGMALSKVVLSTLKGFEGIGITHGVNALQFNSGQEIIEGIKVCIDDHAKYSEMKSSAREHIEASFDYSLLSEKLLDHYKNLN